MQIKSRRINKYLNLFRGFDVERNRRTGGSRNLLIIHTYLSLNYAEQGFAPD